MGRLTRYTARRVAAVGGLLVLALIAGAAPAVAAQPPGPTASDRPTVAHR